jgi:hypothetical protein
VLTMRSRSQGNRTWAQTRCNLGTLFEIYAKVPNLCCLAEEVAKWSREKNCSRPLQSSGRGWKTDEPLPRMGKGSLLKHGQNHGNVKDTITVTMCASGR